MHIGNFRKSRIAKTYLQRTESYINNLHPERHIGLYSIIEEILSIAIHQWDSTLSSVAQETPMRLRMEDDGYDYSGLTEEQRHTWWPSSQEDDPRGIVHPEPPDFESSDWFKARSSQNQNIPSVNLRSEYGSLQIIVKLANINLTPESPEYSGGSWHLEGQLNENMSV